MGELSPDSLVDRQAKRDNALFAACLHDGHSAGSVHLLMGRITSNLVLQSGQTYS
jgi:hypothetical protein